MPIQTPLVIGSAEAVYNSARMLRDGTSSSGEMLMLNTGLSGELPGETFRYFAGAQDLLDERPQLPASAEIPAMTLSGYGRTFLVQFAADY